MSYIICSNEQRDYKKLDNNNSVGLQDPNSFRNYFKSPLIVEPNSEIAVQSLKIRKPFTDLVIKEVDHLYLYFGKEFDHTAGSLYEQAQTPRTSVLVYFTPGTYSPQQFGLELRDAVNKAPLPPGLFGRVDVEVELDADQQFIGYKFTFNHIKTGTDKASTYGTISETEGQVPGVGDAVWGTGYDWVDNGTNKEFSPSDEFAQHPCGSVLTNYPMANASTANGRSIIQFLIQDGGSTFARTNDTQWAVGLTRPIHGQYQYGKPRNSLVADDDIGFFDYYVVYDHAQGGLFVKEFNTQVDGISGGDKNLLRSRDIEYFGAGRPFTSRITHTEISASTLNTIRFAIDGDKVKLEIGTNGGTYYDLVDPDNAALNAFKKGRFKTINNMTEALYPKVVFAGENRDPDCTIEIDRFEAFVNDKFIYPNFTTAPYSRGSSFASQFGNNPLPKLAYHKSIDMATDNRPATNARNADTTTFTYITNTASRDGTINYNHVIIEGAERGSDMSLTSGTTYVLSNQASATMGQRLGYGDLAVIEQSGPFGAYAGGKTTFTPKTPPQTRSNTLYVRLNNLPFTSFNGTTNSISKILYSIPPYDNSGNSVGIVYHAPPEKTYIKLNNPDRIMLNELDTDIVRRDESVSKDCIGTTSVCYHIRQSKDPISNHTQLF